jgi:hypothetical protein
VSGVGCSDIPRRARSRRSSRRSRRPCTSIPSGRTHSALATRPRPHPSRRAHPARDRQSCLPLRCCPVLRRRRRRQRRLPHLRPPWHPAPCRLRPHHRVMSICGSTRSNGESISSFGCSGRRVDPTRLLEDSPTSHRRLCTQTSAPVQALPASIRVGSPPVDPLAWQPMPFGGRTR